jgi:hypothetical protein
MSEQKDKSDLSRLYHMDTTSGPDKSVDQAILDAARKEIQKQPAATTSRGVRWYVPVTLAASLVLVIVMLQVILRDESPVTEQVADNGQPQLSDQHVGSGKPPPEIKLEKINQLLKDGRITEAEQEFEAFSELFPGYEIDFEKYPYLKHFDNK